jgi:hypothetical protein
MSNITKQGIINTSCISETFVNPLDTNFYVEPDSSVWIRIVHHNNPASSRFASTDTFTSSVYLDGDRWFYASLVNKITNGTYEFMVKQKQASTSTEEKYRWIQTKSPFEAVYADVSPSSSGITRITTSGYNVNTSSGGIYKFNSSNTFFVITNTSNGNWYGALGSWTVYQNGTPGFPNTTITSGYMDLYLRISQSISLYNTNSISAKEIIEL